MTTVTVTATSEHLEPTSRACSLLGECDISPGTGADYRILAPYHYRDTKGVPATHQVYRAVHRPSGRVVGVIVYAAPALNLGIRNKLFGERYKIGGTSVTNAPRAARLNRELELISRVVVHPTFRGAGLGRRLIAETLPLRPYRFVEMSAAMGSVNPFAAHAGMRAYLVPLPPNTERVLASLRSVGISTTEMGNPTTLLARVNALSPAASEQIKAELIRYALRWIKSRTKRTVHITLEEAAKRIAANSQLSTMYYLWESKSENRGDAVPAAKAARVHRPTGR